MCHKLLCSIIAVVLLLVANCASATLWISILGGHRAKLTNGEGRAPEYTIRVLDNKVLRLQNCCMGSSPDSLIV